MVPPYIRMGWRVVVCNLAINRIKIIIINKKEKIIKEEDMIPPKFCKKTHHNNVCKNHVVMLKYNSPTSPSSYLQELLLLLY